MEKLTKLNESTVDRIMKEAFIKGIDIDDYDESDMVFGKFFEYDEFNSDLYESMGIHQNFPFRKNVIDQHKEEIEELLAQVNDKVRLGGTFADWTLDKNGNVWTLDPAYVDAIVALAEVTGHKINRKQKGEMFLVSLD